MAGVQPPEEAPRGAPRPADESLLRGGLIGISAVAAATAALAVAGAVIAFITTLFF